MLDILWSSLGLFVNFQQGFEELKQYRTKTLFISSLTISIAALLSLLMSENLLIGAVAPHTVFFNLIAHYIMAYFFISILLIGVCLFRYKVNMVRFLSYYLITDLPFLAVLPIALLGVSIPVLKIIVPLVISFLGFVSWVYKVQLLMKYFKLTFFQVILLYFIPALLVLFLIVAALIGFFNQLTALF